MPPKTIHTEDQKANALLALQANGGDVQATARELGLAARTLQNWKAGTGVSERVLALLDKKRPALAERLGTLAHQLLDHIFRKLKKANVPQLVAALNIALDKIELLTLREKPLPVTDEARFAAVAEILQAKLEHLREARARPVADCAGATIAAAQPPPTPPASQSPPGAD